MPAAVCSTILRVMRAALGPVNSRCGQSITISPRCRRGRLDRLMSSFQGKRGGLCSGEARYGMSGPMALWGYSMRRAQECSVFDSWGGLA
jgi:hypothetical protein